MLVEAAYGWVAEENGSAAVGLKAVFVGIDDDGVGVGDGVVGGAGLGSEVGGEGEVASVGGVYVDAEVVPLLKFQDLVERVYGADGGGAQGDDYGTDVSGREELLEGGEVHAAGVVSWHADEGQAEDAGDAAVGVVSLVGGGYGFAGCELAGYPEGFEVGEGSSA